MLKAYSLVGYRPRKSCRFIEVNRSLGATRQQAIVDLLAAIDGVGGKCEETGSIIRINNEFTMSVAISRCRPTMYGYPRWHFAVDRNPASDITVVIRMNRDFETVRDYLVVPTTELADDLVVLSAHNGIELDGFCFATLAPLIALAARAKFTAGIGATSAAPSLSTPVARSYLNSGAWRLAAPKRRDGRLGSADLLRDQAEDLHSKHHLLEKADGIRNRLGLILECLSRLSASSAFLGMLAEEGLASIPKVLVARVSGRSLVPTTQAVRSEDGQDSANLTSPKPGHASVRLICSEVAELLEESPVPDKVFDEFRKMVAVRQVEAARLLLAMNRVSTNHAKLLVAVTPQVQLLAVRRPTKVAGLTNAQAAVMEFESSEINNDFWRALSTHANEHLEMVVATGYLRRLLQNVRVVMHLARNSPELFSELQMGLV